MRKSRIARFAVCSLALAAACGDNSSSSIECGEGTFEYMGQCVPFDPNDATAPVTAISPDGGQLPTSAAVRLVADEPATIYYTTDGSEPTTSSTSGASPVVIPSLPVRDGDVTVRFFAVDAAGNTEAAQSKVFTRDVAPGAVSSLAVTIAGTDATVSWAAPSDADLAGVVIARLTGPVTPPEDGATYTAGDSIAPGVNVVYVGTAASFVDAELTPGYARYAAWAYDVWGSYSQVRVGGAELALPAQTASLSVDVAATTASVTATPSFIGLNVGTVTYDSGNSYLLIPLTLQNRTSRAMFNVKAVVTSLSTGDVGNGQGTFDGDPYVYVTVASAPGATHERILQINNVAADATVTIDLTIADHPLLIGPSTWAQPATQGSSAQLFDTGVKGFVARHLPQLDNMMGPGGSENRAPAYLGGSVSDDGRWFYLSGRQSSRVVAIDLTTMQPVLQSAPLTLGKGHAVWPRLVAERDMLYVGVNDGTHAYREPRRPTGPRTFMLAALSASTLAELDRVELPSSLGDNAAARIRAVALSPDKRTAAVAIMSGGTGYDNAELHLVDLMTMSIIDTDTGTAGYQPLSVADAGDLAFSPDGGTIYLGPVFKVGADLQVIDMATFAVSRLTVAAAGARVTFAPDGKLFIGTTGGTGMWVHTPGTTLVTLLPNYADAVGAMVFDRSGNLWAQPSIDSDDIVQVDPADGTVLTTMAGDGRLHAGGHWLAVTPF